MAVEIQVTGPATIKVDTGSSNALETLGYSEDSISIEFPAFWSDVYGDAHGGREGPPIDSQYLGQIARGRLVLTRWDAAVFAKLEARVYGGTAGTVSSSDIGALMLQGSKTTRLVLDSAVRPKNFPLTIFREAIELPMGTKHSILVIPFEARRNLSSGVLWNTTVS